MHAAIEKCFSVDSQLLLYEYMYKSEKLFDSKDCVFWVKGR